MLDRNNRTRHSEAPQSFVKQTIKDQDSRSLLDFSTAMLGAGQLCSSAVEIMRGKDSNQKFYSSQMIKQVKVLK